MSGLRFPKKDHSTLGNRLGDSEGLEKKSTVAITEEKSADSLIDTRVIHCPSLIPTQGH